MQEELDKLVQNIAKLEVEVTKRHLSDEQAQHLLAELKGLQTQLAALSALEQREKPDGQQ